MSLTSQSLLPRQKCLIAKLRLNDSFIHSPEWDDDLESSDLGSLQALREVYYCTHQTEGVTSGWMCFESKNPTWSCHS